MCIFKNYFGCPVESELERMQNECGETSQEALIIAQVGEHSGYSGLDKIIVTTKKMDLN